MSLYQPGIPTGTVDLDIDYLNIQNNFRQLDISFGVDHVTFSSQTAQNGYHTNIHFNPVSTTTTNPPNNQPAIIPPTTPGYGQLFTAQVNDGINADDTLYFLSGLGNLSQLTRNFQPVIANNGYTYLPGGLIYQYGSAVSNIASPNASIVFPLAFPANVFGVQICVLENSSSRRIWHISTLNLTGFTAYIQDNGGGSVANTFYWTAIGN